MKLQACNDWIVVERTRASKETKSGLIAVIEDRAQYEGKVVSVGRDVDIAVEPGCLVIWGKWEGTIIRIKDKDYTAIRCSDVILASKP